MNLKVLFHINEARRWQMVFTNITNFINDVGPGNAAIEVVANGEAVKIFADNSDHGLLLEEMQKLAEKGVEFMVCRNALQSQAIDAGNLPPFIKVVPAGITEIARKQVEGYAYIKP